MSDLKNGDIVELTSGLVNNLYHGDRLKFITSDGDNALLSQTIIVPKHIFKKVKEFKMDYEISNRKKLHDYIKASGHTSVALGEALGNKWYFSNITKPSRMKRGDISNTELSRLKDSVYSCSYEIESSKLDKKYTNKESIESIVSRKLIDADTDDIIKGMSDGVLSKNSHLVTNKHAPKYSSFIKLQKLAFAICFIIVVLLISVLYFVVSK